MSFKRLWQVRKGTQGPRRCLVRSPLSLVLATLSLVLATGLLIAALSMIPASTSAKKSASANQCTVANGLGSFASPGSLPGACWRPYSNKSPFNRQIRKDPKLVSGSPEMVAELLRGGPILYFVGGGDPQFDVGSSIYFSGPHDPSVRVHCTYSDQWGPCALEGRTIKVPASALPAGGFSTKDNRHDAHMTIVDQSSGWEYDFWNVQSRGAGQLVIGYGGRTRIDGLGLGSDAVAARYGNLAGLVRAAELKAGRIHHALALHVPCTRGFVYPASKGGFPCSELGVANGIPMGAHFQLKIKAKQIRSLRLPRWKKALVIALKRYGAYVSDTTGSQEYWGFKFESSNGHTVFGLPDPWVELGQSLGLEASDYNANGHSEYWFDVAAGVPWHRLRIVR